TDCRLGRRSIDPVPGCAARAAADPFGIQPRRQPVILSDVSIKRPVVALVASIIVVLIGLLSFGRLPVREYPSIDTPIVTVQTSYRGASAEVVESKITEPLEKEIASIDGIRTLRSESREESSNITVEFTLDRDV